MASGSSSQAVRSGIIMQKLLVFRRAQIARPHYARVVDIRGVVNPFVLEDVLRPIAHEHQLLAGRLRELLIECQRGDRVEPDRKSFGYTRTQSAPGTRTRSNVRRRCGSGCSARDADQHEETRQRAQIVHFEEGIEIDAQREEQERQRHPQESVVAQFRKKNGSAT